MTEGPDNQSVFARLADKWQIPLLLVGLVGCATAGIVFMLSAPGPKWEATFSELSAQVDQVADGDYTEVAKGAQAMLSTDVTGADQLDRRRRLHMLLGEIRWHAIGGSSHPNERQWVGLRDEYLNALKVGQPDDAVIATRLGAAQAALGDTAGAIARLKVAAAALPVTERGDLLRQVIELREQQGEAPTDELLAELTQYVKADGLTPEQYGWAIGSAVDLLIGDNRLIRASRLIDGQLTRGLDEACTQWLSYHRARLLVKRGLIEQADNVLISLSTQLKPSSALALECGLLRGELIWRDNPSEAVGLFADIQNRAAGTPAAVAAQIGMAHAYLQMQLPADALAQYAPAVQLLASQKPNPLVDLPELRRMLIEQYDMRMAAAQPDQALRFVELERTVAELISAEPSHAERTGRLGRLAGAHRASAEQAAESHRQAKASDAPRDQLMSLQEQRRDHLEAAGEALLEMAAMASATDDSAHGDSLWTAATMFDMAGLRDESIEVLERFVDSRPTDLRVPEARFLLGRSLQASGRYDDAIGVYKANLQTRTPTSRHIKAVEGLIPMAQCYVAKGEEFFDEAEQVLQGVVTGREEVTPQSALYLQALYGLGRLYHRQGKWRLARRALSEAIERDPGQLVPIDQSDPEQQRPRYIRATRSTYLIADSYQFSAREAFRHALDMDTARRRVLRETAREQLGQAEKLYQKVIDRIEKIDGPRESVDEVMRRNSYFAKAECMYDMARYPDALERYQQAVHKFQHRPEALAGLTAMYNCYMELGQSGEARAALARAVELQKHLQPSDTDAAADESTLESWGDWLLNAQNMDPQVANVSE